MGDVSKNAIEVLQNEYANLTVVETTADEFDSGNDDLIIINIAEYFMSQEEITRFVSKGGGVVLNNVHLYFPGTNWIVYSCIREIRAFFINMLSFVTGQRQQQFRGWWRSPNDYMATVKGSGKYVKNIVFNRERTSNTRFGELYFAMIHIDRIG